MKIGIPLPHKTKQSRTDNIRIGCPICPQQLRVSRARVGRPICCPTCFHTFRVPAPIHRPELAPQP